MSPDEQAVQISREFLQPYVNMPYPGSVRAVKTAVAAVEDRSPEEARAEELKMFASRWGCADNVAEILRRSRPHILHNNHGGDADRTSSSSS